MQAEVWHLPLYLKVPDHDILLSGTQSILILPQYHAPDSAPWILGIAPVPRDNVEVAVHQGSASVCQKSGDRRALTLHHLRPGPGSVRRLNEGIHDHQDCSMDGWGCSCGTSQPF